MMKKARRKEMRKQEKLKIKRPLKVLKLLQKKNQLPLRMMIRLTLERNQRERRKKTLLSHNLEKTPNLMSLAKTSLNASP